MLILTLHFIIGSALAGSAVVAALVSGYDTLYPILIAAGVGYALSFPVTWLVAREIKARG